MKIGLYKKLFWKKTYSYRISKSNAVTDGERIVSMSMAYHNSHPAGMITYYLIESVSYHKDYK